MSWAIETHALTKRYPRAAGWRIMLDKFPSRQPAGTGGGIAVDSASLCVQEGELFGLLGPNGAGKTTLIKMLATLIEPTSGSARINGFDLSQETDIKANCGLVTSDERSFYWRLTGRQNLSFFATLHGLESEYAQERVSDCLRLVDLVEVADRRFLTYSTGMRQRLSIARALLNNPRLLFLDEPTKGLDPIATQHLHQLVRHQLVEQQGMTILLTTHNLDEAERLCDRIAIMSQGRLRAIGKVQELRRALDRGSHTAIQVSRLPAPARQMLVERYGQAGVSFVEAVSTFQDPGSPLDQTPGAPVEEIRLQVPGGEDALNEAIDILRSQSVTIRSVQTQTISLDEVFNYFVAAPMPVPSNDPPARAQELPPPRQIETLRAPSLARGLARILPAFLQRDLLQEASYRISFFLQFFNVFFTALIFYFISELIGEAASPFLTQYGGDYFSYVLIGIAFLGYFSTGLSSFSNSLRHAQTTGTLEAMLTTPTSLSAIIISSSLWDYLVTTLRVFVYLAVGILFMRVDFTGGNYLAAVLVIILTVLSASSLGILAASFVMVLKRGDPINWGVSTLTAFFGGVYYPYQLLPPALGWIAYLLPITYSLDAMRKALLESASWSELLPDLLALLLFACVLLPLSLLAFRYSVHRARVEGSLTQY